MRCTFPGCRGALAVWAAVAALAAAEKPSPLPTEVLPPVSVGGYVPLEKVAEHTLRERRFAPAAVAHGGFIYIIGGQSEDRLLASIERFDPATGKSEHFADLAAARLWHNAAVVGDQLYVLGGMSTAGDDGSLRGYAQELSGAKEQMRAGFDLSVKTARPGTDVVPGTRPEAFGLDDSVEVVDLKTGKVAAGPRMPVAKDQFGCVVAGGKLFVFGGYARRKDGAAFTNSVEVLDLATGQWRSGPPFPDARITTATPVAGGFILLTGGYNGRKMSAAVSLFNPAEQTWRDLPPLVHPVSAHAAVALGQYLFLFGNYPRPEEIVIYDLKTRKSEAFTLGYTPSRHTAAVTLGDRIYVIGGREVRGALPLDKIQVFALRPKRTAPPAGAPAGAPATSSPDTSGKTSR